MLCKGKMLNGRPCRNRAVINGYCVVHWNKRPVEEQRAVRKFLEKKIGF